MRNRPQTLIFAVCALSALAGCSEPHEEAVVQTVEYYKTHDAERKRIVEACGNNPGELAATPNCVNACTADEALTWNSRGVIQAKPLTADDMKKKE